jgi:hypothetical protein
MRLSTMTNFTKKRTAFRPSVVDSKLEDRLVLSGASAAVSVAPVAAPPPVPSSVLISRPAAWKSVVQLRAAYKHQAQLETLDLRNIVGGEVEQLYASGAVPTSQQLIDLNATVQGTIDAAALQLSSQASLLPGSGGRLVPAIQNTLLGSLAGRLGSDFQSGGDTVTGVRLQSVMARQIMASDSTLNARFDTFFATTNVKALAVNSGGQRIPIAQFMGTQVVSQLSNSLGSLAQSFPNVANAMLFPAGSTVTPTQAVTALFGQQATAALATAAFQLSSSLSMFSGFSPLVSRLQPMLVGSESGVDSLASTLENLPLGDSGLSTAVLDDVTSGFSKIIAPVDSFLGLQSQSNLTLPTTGFTSPFGSQFTTSSFANGFNNGFASGTSTGFVGFGAAPTGFNSSFDTGFNSTINGYFTTLLGIVGTNNGTPIAHSE